VAPSVQAATSGGMGPMLSQGASRDCRKPELSAILRYVDGLRCSRRDDRHRDLPVHIRK
jgi:hypothetical protein